MNKEDLKNSFDSIEPNEFSTQKMLDKVLNHSNEKEKVNFMKQFNYKKAIPALALALVLAGSLLTYNLIPGNEKQESTPGDRLIGGDDLGREDAAMPMLNQFQMDNMHYIILSDNDRANFNLSATINNNDIGDKIITITTSVDSSLKGSEVFSYTPAGGNAIVAVLRDNEYELFKFLSFESYNNNQDEDSITYLKLYGINAATDISKIQFIGHSDQSKIEGKTDLKGEITDVGEIAKFYNHYSVIKNSSDKYFDKLFNYKGSNLPREYSTEGTPGLAPDQLPDAVHDLPQNQVDRWDDGTNAVDLPAISDDLDRKGTVDTGQSGGSTEPYEGSIGNALNDPITIRIYNQSGVYYQAIYYPNLGFISRHEVSDDFASFLSDYIK